LCKASNGSKINNDTSKTKRMLRTTEMKTIGAITGNTQEGIPKKTN